MADVWNVVKDSMQWFTWWKGMLSVTEIEAGDETGLHNKRKYTCRSLIPYKLCFTLHVVKVIEEKFIGGLADGALTGSGDMHFSYDAATNCTTVICKWHVGTTVKWMNAFSFMLKPVFAYNHNYLMRQGAKGLAKKLQAKLISC